MSANPKYWHDKGEQDYPDNWDPPVAGIFDALSIYNDNDIINMNAYKAGWANARSQAGD